MADTPSLVELHAPSDGERDALVLELQRLLACYQLASPDDRNVVWAALNKYAPLVNEI